MTRKQPPLKTYAEKMRQANREALITLGAFLVVLLAWLIGGFGLAGSDMTLAGIPLWVIGGTLGPWLVAVIVAVVLARFVFRNFALGDDDLRADPAAEAGSPQGAPQDQKARAVRKTEANAQTERKVNHG